VSIGDGVTDSQVCHVINETGGNFGRKRGKVEQRGIVKGIEKHREAAALCCAIDEGKGI
jgi:hypothetical protein